MSAVCPFCETRLLDKTQLKEHLKDVHEISVKLLSKYNCETTNVPECSTPQKATPRKPPETCEKMRILKCTLFENYAEYMETMRKWLRSEITRSQFDESVRHLFTEDTVSIHNEFLFDFLREIRTISKSDAWKSEFPPVQHLKPVDSASVCPKDSRKRIGEASSFCKDGSDDASSILKTAVPDYETLYALSLLSALERDNRNIEKKVVPIINNAVEELMKNMYLAIMMRRKNFKVRSDGFVYDVGKVNPDEIHPDDQPIYSGHITLTELLDVLETHPHLIPIKSVYNYTIQTIIGALKGIADEQKAKNENA